eukprot:1713093-Prymnesium_polylepis.1
MVATRECSLSINSRQVGEAIAQVFSKDYRGPDCSVPTGKRLAGWVTSKGGFSGSLGSGILGGLRCSTVRASVRRASLSVRRTSTDNIIPTHTCAVY